MLPSRRDAGFRRGEVDEVELSLPARDGLVRLAEDSREESQAGLALRFCARRRRAQGEVAQVLLSQCQASEFARAVGLLVHHAPASGRAQLCDRVIDEGSHLDVDLALSRADLLAETERGCDPP